MGHGFGSAEGYHEGGRRRRGRRERRGLGDNEHAPLRILSTGISLIFLFWTWRKAPNQTMKFRLCSVIASFSLARAKASARKRQQDSFPSRSGASSNDIWNDTYDCKLFRFTIAAEFSA